MFGFRVCTFVVVTSYALGARVNTVLIAVMRTYMIKDATSTGDLPVVRSALRRTRLRALPRAGLILEQPSSAASFEMILRSPTWDRPPSGIYSALSKSLIAISWQVRVNLEGGGWSRLPVQRVRGVYTIDVPV